MRVLIVGAGASALVTARTFIARDRENSVGNSGLGRCLRGRHSSGELKRSGEQIDPFVDCPPFPNSDWLNSLGEAAPSDNEVIAGLQLKSRPRRTASCDLLAANAVRACREHIVEDRFELRFAGIDGA